MAERLKNIGESVGGKKRKIGDLSKIVGSCFDYLSLADYLTPEENAQRVSVRQFVEKEISQKIVPFIEKAEFPHYLLPLFKQKRIAKYFFPKPYGFGSRTTMQGVILAEIARGDAGMATLFVVTYLMGFTILKFGTKEQQEKYLPRLANLDMLGAWALTEDDNGSDAAHIKTSAVKTETGYKINGVKNWTGNGTGDLLCLWANNASTKQVQGFLIQTKNLKGLSVQIKKNKMVLRSIAHCRIVLNDVEVSESQLLPNSVNFQKGTSVALQASRVAVLWVATGICMGSYEAAIRYATERQQFGRSISGFQLIQEKLVKMMSTIQGMLLYCFKISKLVEENQADMGMISLAKAWITERGREVCRWGRQICGGNGILSQNYVIRAMAEIQATYTYQGTYDINTLIVGRQLTGISAFK